jgi:hypothetical protein
MKFVKNNIIIKWKRNKYQSTIKTTKTLKVTKNNKFKNKFKPALKIQITK